MQSLSGIMYAFLDKVLCITNEAYKKAMDMPEGTEAKIKQDLFAEIINLEKNYRLIRSSISAKEYDSITIGATLKDFKDSLSRASAFIMALYNLNGQRVKIPWEQLFTNLDYALATISASPAQKQKAAVQTILSMSQAEFEQVLAYFAALKESLK
jgi:hypothetical protein